MTIAVPQPKTDKTRKPREIDYPVRDNNPMAETDKHADLMVYTKSALRVRYADQPDVYVSGNNFLYYQEGAPKKCVSPDCYVVFGVPNHLRDSYMSWREGEKLPSVVFEFTSAKTRSDDVNIKRPLYESVLRVDEYFLFDPTGDYLNPRLQGFRLVEGRYQAIPLENGRMRSEQLGLDLVQQGETMRLFDPQRGEFLLDALEMAQRVAMEAKRADLEAYKAELAAQKAEAETQRANEEAQRAADADRRANEEAQARTEAEADNARLRAQLAALLGKSEN